MTYKMRQAIHITDFLTVLSSLKKEGMMTVLGKLNNDWDEEPQQSFTFKPYLINPQTYLQLFFLLSITNPNSDFMGCINFLIFVHLLQCGTFLTNIRHRLGILISERFSHPKSVVVRMVKTYLQPPRPPPNPIWSHVLMQ